MSAHYLGNIMWQQAGQATGLDPTDLPDSTGNIWYFRSSRRLSREAVVVSGVGIDGLATRMRDIQDPAGVGCRALRG